MVLRRQDDYFEDRILSIILTKAQYMTWYSKGKTNRDGVDLEGDIGLLSTIFVRVHMCVFEYITVTILYMFN